MGKVKKSTKKFIKSKLKNEIELRKKRKEKTKFLSKKEPKETVEEQESSDDEQIDSGFLDEAPESDAESEEMSEDDDSEDFSDESEFDDEETMQRELEKLQENDPKFYEFLKENDEKLLEFANEDEQEEVEEESEKEETISKETIHKLRTAMSSRNSIKAWNQLVKYFRESTELEENLDHVFNLVCLTTLKYSPQVLNHHLHEKKPQDAKKWKRLRHKIKTLLNSIVKLQERLTSLSMKRFLIKQSEQLVHYFNCFPKITRVFVKQLVELWSTSDQEQIRILSFLFLRKLAMEHPNPYLNMVFKASFTSFMNTARHTTVHSWAQISFMSNCLVELGGLSLQATYMHTFVYLRELAIKLRQATTTKTKENYKLIYNWQFLHAVRLWSNLLCTYCSNEQIEKDQQVLKPLIYPLVQIMIGIMRLKPSSKHFPLRLSIIRCLIEISQKTKVYIPVAAYLLDVFESNEMSKKPKPSTLKPLDFKMNIRAPNTYLGTRTYYNGLLEEVIHLLYEFFSVHALSIAFPELAVPAIVQLKKISKNGTDFAKNKQIQQLIEKV
jgi:nucleolar complex protein 2